MSNLGDSAQLPRHLGVTDTVALYVGIILGSGIFVAPAVMASLGSSPSDAILLWVFGGFVAICGAFTYAECGARLPHPGGFYVFYRQAFGPGTAFVGGWAAYLVTYPASIAAIAYILARYLRNIFPALTGLEPLVATAALAIAGALNIIGMRTGPMAQRVLSTVKVLALLVLCGAAVLYAPEATTASDLGPSAPWDAWVLAAMLLMWTYDGWSNVGLFAAEVVEPNRTLGRSVVIGTAILVAVYAAVQLAVNALLPRHIAANSEQVVSDAVTAGLGDGMGVWVSVLIVISTFGAIGGSIFSGARVGYAMAQDRLLPSWLGETSPRWKTPVGATVVLTIACIAWALSGRFDQLLAVFSFSAWFFYGLVAVALLIFRRRGVGGTGVWTAPGGMTAPLVILGSAAAMMIGVVLHSPIKALIGSGLLALGFVVYLVLKRNRVF